MIMTQNFCYSSSLYILSFMSRCALSFGISYNWYIMLQYALYYLIKSLYLSSDGYTSEMVRLKHIVVHMNCPLINYIASSITMYKYQDYHNNN